MGSTRASLLVLSVPTKNYGLSLLGSTVVLITVAIINSSGSAKLRKHKKVAARDRAAWARKWNKKLMEKLELQEAPSVTKP